ncbi:MAG: type II toxin-antitoxin system VapC family toxin [Clostridiales bacterium]|nr:type II toxin-antitoxin system VapC family toxin [Clostridiales bacterium]
MYLLDTNICISLMRNQYPKMTDKILSMDPSLLMISSITVFELEYGAAKSQQKERTQAQLAMFLSAFTILPFDAGDAIAAGRIRGELAKKGTPIGPYDLQIAAQGLSRKLTVVTHNIDEFSRVQDLQVEDWVS